jgi:CRP-like cAMP-binding protein
MLKRILFMENLNVSTRSVIFKEGEKASKLYIVKSGEILCLKSTKDRLIPIFLAKEGDVIGESAMIHDSNYSYSAISLANSEIVEITSFSFKQVFGKAPDWILNLVKTMVSRFQVTSSLISENRIVHSSIISEDRYSPQVEIDFKKLISQ